MNNAAVSFPNWHDALARAPLDPRLRAAYAREIIAFLRHCKVSHTPATADLAKQFLSARETQSSGPVREALRWFFREGRRASHVAARDTRRDSPRDGRSGAPPHQSGDPAPPRSVAAAVSILRGDAAAPARTRPLEPPPATRDLGSTPWESALIKAMRERGLLWRSEVTYREWAVRFARFLAPRSPYAASGEDVAAFLSELAVHGRASASTQKQALNALVFLMQEALHHDLGQLNFERARPRRRIPTVLSTGECQSLFVQLDGTARLMAELAYGAGLRLLELLRLRVHHLDLERRRLQVYAGKGDKDRVTVLPDKLVAGLRDHTDRLRELWAADQCAHLPGVWMPEGLAKKYPRAGVSWEWQWLFPSRTPALDPGTGRPDRVRLCTVQ